MFYLVRVGSEYYAGLSPTGRMKTVPTPEGAYILNHPDAVTVLNQLGTATLCEVTINESRSALEDAAMKPAVELIEKTLRTMSCNVSRDTIVEELGAYAPNYMTHVSDICTKLACTHQKDGAQAFVQYARGYGYTVPPCMAVWALEACGQDFDEALSWCHKCNEAILPAVKAVCDSVHTQPEAAYEPLMRDGPTDAAGYMARVDTAVVALLGLPLIS